ncbi:unnamed protein product [Hapterophycus canaliculatus]
MPLYQRCALLSGFLGLVGGFHVPVPAARSLSILKSTAADSIKEAATLDQKEDLFDWNKQVNPLYRPTTPKSDLAFSGQMKRSPEGLYLRETENLLSTWKAFGRTCAAETRTYREIRVVLPLFPEHLRLSSPEKLVIPYGPHAYLAYGGVCRADAAVF